MAKLPKNPAMVLQELTVKNNWAPPEYEIIHSIAGSHENRFDYKVRVLCIEAVGSGTSKQVSKHDAALKALMKLKDIGKYDPLEIPVEEFKAAVIHKAAGYIPGSPLKSSLNCIGTLKDLCVDNKIEDPAFTELSDVGPPHAREFTYECKIGSLKTVATGNTKKMAKQLTAKEMIEKIKAVLPDISVEAPRRNEEQKTLPVTEKDRNVLEIYNRLFGNVVADKKVKVKHFPGVFRRLMRENDVLLDHLLEDLEERSEESLERILNRIGLKYEIIVIQSSPWITTLCVNCDVPFGAIGMASTEESARNEALKDAFEMLDYFIKLEDPDSD